MIVSWQEIFNLVIGDLKVGNQIDNSGQLQMKMSGKIIVVSCCSVSLINIFPLTFSSALLNMCISACVSACVLCVVCVCICVFIKTHISAFCRLTDSQTRLNTIDTERPSYIHTRNHIWIVYLLLSFIHKDVHGTLPHIQTPTHHAVLIY